MVKFFVMLVLFFSNTCYADDIPDPQLWYDAIRPKLESQKLITNIAFLKHKKNSLSPIKIKQRMARELALFDIVEASLINFQQQMNPETFNKKHLEKEPSIFRQLPVDAIIILESKKMTIFNRWHPKQLSFNYPSASKSTNKRLEIFKNKLGYNGMILDKRDNFLLIRSMNIFPPDAQALALRNSHDDFIIGTQSAKGEALLQLVKSKRYLGVFEVIVTGGKEDMKPGTKILVGEPGKLN